MMGRRLLTVFESAPAIRRFRSILHVGFKPAFALV
jgi:hypothetical protein